MFDRVNTMTGVISLGIGERDMSTPKLVCEELRQTFLNRGEQEQRPGMCLLEGRRDQLLPLKPENHTLKRFSERAGMEAECGDCFCV